MEEQEHHTRTIRQNIIDLLIDEELNARDLSQAIGIPEKDVYEHLSHIERSVEAQGKRLIILPFRCLVCGFIFEKRKRFTRPGRCPSCKKGHLQRPTYRVVSV
ncbi:MAG: transcriptional regulator [Thermodesulfobacteriota bacterium]|nr:transcriptional regulator [Thermodesulfobacteriota bacterium]